MNAYFNALWYYAALSYRNNLIITSIKKHPKK